MIDCNGKDVTQASKDFIDNLEEGLIKSERQFENCDRCKKQFSDKIDKIRAEILDTLYVDSLIFGELIDFQNGKISADDVIEEFNRVTRLEVLKILDKYMAESEDK